jgi:hypothetical protein
VLNLHRHDPSLLGRRSKKTKPDQLRTWLADLGRPARQSCRPGIVFIFDYLYSDSSAIIASVLDLEGDSFSDISVVFEGAFVIFLAIRLE